jgi:hypothetical protein
MAMVHDVVLHFLLLFLYTVIDIEFVIKKNSLFSRCCRFYMLKEAVARCNLLVPLLKLRGVAIFKRVISTEAEKGEKVFFDT